MISVLIAIIVVISTATASSSSSSQQPLQQCEVTINKRLYRADKRLYTHKQYEITFGLPFDESNPPIMYSIDADCRNLSKLRAAFSFDIKNMPVEVNLVNCSNRMNFINVLESSSFLAPASGFNNNTFLTFLVDFRSLKVPSSSSLKLNINRHFGKGCSSTLTFVKHDGSSSSLFDYDYYDGTSLWSKVREYLWSYIKTVTNPPVLLGILSTIFFALLIILGLVLVCMRRKINFRMDELMLGGTLVKLRNITKRHHNPNNHSYHQQIPPTTNQEVDQNSSPQTPTHLVQASCPTLADLDYVDNRHSNEFHLLREQLINRG